MLKSKDINILLSQLCHSTGIVLKMFFKKAEHLLLKIDLILSLLTILCIIIIDSLWIAAVCVYAKRTWRYYRWYQRHPDSIDASSRWFILYNSKTHLTKCIFMLGICMSEILMTVSYSAMFISYHWIKTDVAKDSNHTDIVPLDVLPQSRTLECLFRGFIFFVLLFINLFSLLTQYLTSRTLCQSYRPRRYLIWIVIQYAILLLCSFRKASIFIFVFTPTVSSINWILFYKDTKMLSRALKSNLHSMWLIEQSSVYYKSQLLMVKIYRNYIRILLAALFVQVTAIVFGSIFLFIELILYDHYALSLIYKKDLKLKELPHSIHRNLLLNGFTFKMIDIFAFIYLVMIALPPLTFTLALVGVAIYRRWKNGRPRYRFNYENQQLLLRNIQN